MIGIVVKILCFIARVLLTHEQAYRMAARRAVRDPLPKIAKVICSITFGATTSRLTRGAQATSRRIMEMCSSLYYSRATILFGEFTLNPTSGLEEQLKKEIFPPNAKSFGRVISTIEDIERPLAMLSNDIDPIIFVTDEAHSRSVRTIINRCLAQRNSIQRIYVDCVSTRDVIDQENPMNALRDPRDWVAVNRFREFILWFPFGFALLKGSGVHQPSSEIKTA